MATPLLRRRQKKRLPKQWRATKQPLQFNSSRCPGFFRGSFFLI
jgi:hypothetical protein